MSRIEANLATQLGDVTRPPSHGENLTAQNRQAQVIDMKKAGSDAVGNPVSADDIRATAQRLKQVLEAASGKSFAFGLKYDEPSKDLVVEFKDDAGKVVREIPSKEIRQLRQRMDDLVGLLFNKEA